MTETLGVLALIGVLTIVAVAGIKFAGDKMKANTIINDSKMVFVDSQKDKEKRSTSEWIDPELTLESNTQIGVRADLLQRVYVLATAIPQGVCNRMLDMRSEGILDFYTVENASYVICQDTNDIVIDWNGEGAPAECVAVENCDGADICDSAYQCAFCPELMRPNGDSTDCVCDPTKALTCTAGEDTWCCGENNDGEATICGATNGSCLPSDGTCAFELSETVAGNPTYKGDCYFDLGNTGMKTITDSEGIITIGTIPSFTRGGGTCGENEYCALFWASESNTGVWTEKPVELANNTTGRIWGLCQKQNTYTSKWVATLSYSSTPTFNALVPCPAKKYCYTFWISTEASCPTIMNDTFGMVYGVCIDQKQKRATCPFQEEL